MSAFWRWLRMPDPMFAGTRVIDTLVAAGVLLAAIIVHRIWPHEGWTVWSIPLSVVGFALSRRYIPDSKEVP